MSDFGFNLKMWEDAGREEKYFLKFFDLQGLLDQCNDYLHKTLGLTETRLLVDQVGEMDGDKNNHLEMYNLELYTEVRGKRNPAGTLWPILLKPGQIRILGKMIKDHFSKWFERVEVIPSESDIRGDVENGFCGFEVNTKKSSLIYGKDYKTFDDDDKPIKYKNGDAIEEELRELVDRERGWD